MQRKAIQSFVTSENINEAKHIIRQHIRRTIVISLLLETTNSTNYTDAKISSFNIMIHRLYRHIRMSTTLKSRRLPRLEGKRITFQQVTGWLHDEKFRLAFRMDRSTFNALNEKLMPAQLKCPEMGSLSSDGVISPQVRLGTALRLFAGAGVFDMMMLFHISTSSVYKCVSDVLDAVNKHFELPGIPTELDECRKIAEWMTYSRGRANPFHGCIFALDGIAIRIEKLEDKDMPREYRCRKGFFALPLLAAVDGKYRFLCFSLRCPGAIHDSLAYAVSNIHQFLQSGRLPIEVWGVADEAFINTANLLVPFPSTGVVLDPFCDAFNFFLSSFRIHVEQAFGMLVARWDILRHGLRYSLQTTFKTVKALLLLHNYCVENSDFFSLPLKSDPGRDERDSRWEEWVEQSTSVFDEIERQITDATGKPTPVSNCARRDFLVAELRRRNLRRPSPSH